jgi:hypothetical protein
VGVFVAFCPWGVVHLVGKRLGESAAGPTTELGRVCDLGGLQLRGTRVGEAPRQCRARRRLRAVVDAVFELRGCGGIKDLYIHAFFLRSREMLLTSAA